MADNNLARSRNDVPEFFADGDPLAELARIVGYEDRVVANPAPPVAEPVAARRTDPVFNLEDELLREFERYDAPRLDPVDDLVVAEPSIAAMDDVSVEPAFEGNRFVSGLDQATGQDRAQAEGEPLEPWASDGISHDDVASNDEDSDYEADLVDGGDRGVANHAYVESLPDTLPTEPEEAGSWRVPNEAVDAVPAYQAASLADQDLSFDEFDLAAELETSFVSTPVVTPVVEAQPLSVEAQSPPMDAKRKGAGYTPSFRMPLANFQSGAGVASHQRTEAKVELQAAPSKIEPVSFDGWNVAAPVSAAVSVPVISDLPIPAMDIPLAGPAEPIAAKVVAPVGEVAPDLPKDQFADLDALLSGVDHYSVSSRTVAPVVETVQVPVDSEIMSPAPAQPQIYAAPTASSVPSESVDEASDPFADLDFELALDALELDLTDMVVEENSKVVAPVVASVDPNVSAPATVAPVAQPALAPVASPAVAAPVYAAAPVYSAAPAFDLEPEDDVPFDPALLSEPEEQPEAIAELDVPTLPVEEKEEQPAYRNDFDLDIDAELASLLEAPETAASLQRGSVQPQLAAVASAPAAQKSVYADLDDFERALEEDFRRSLATPLTANESYAQAEDYEQNVDDVEQRGSSRRWIAPLVAVGLVAVCGAGAFAWFGNSTSGLGGNGEPMVIAADSEPVKIAPANPGGKTVPNQDKAVYDRVAGAGSETPKQQQLISSSEEPVDVVQKTLMPDTLPLEGENDVQMTDVAETEDPRLLPQDQQQAGEQQAVTVMPRKVKTMIVRADGKLVEQEVEPATTAKIAAAPVRADAPAQQTAAAFPTAAPAPAAPSTGIVPVSAPADTVSTMPVAAQAPASIEQLADTAPAAAVRAPVPTTRPSTQPANVVASVSDQGNVRTAAPAAAAPAAQNTQVASLGEGGYVIQIASLPSQADAQKSYQSLSNKFGSVIGGRGVDIKAAEVAGKGTFYRVRIPAGSKEQAVALCEKYRSAGGSCLVAR